MRLWHKNLIHVLPKKQLIAQWRECCCIAVNIKTKGTPNHLLVNKILEYNKSHFYEYCCLVCNEMYKRGYKVSNQSIKKILNYCTTDEKQISSRIMKDDSLFYGWHNERYLMQCYYNLQEKYDCGGITQDEWNKIENYIKRIKNN